MLRALDTQVLDALSVLLRRFGLSKAADLVDDELIYRDLLTHIKLKRAMGGRDSFESAKLTTGEFNEP